MQQTRTLVLQVVHDPAERTWHVGVLLKEGKHVEFIRAVDPPRTVGAADVLAYITEVARPWLWARALDEEEDMRAVTYVAGDLLR